MPLYIAKSGDLDMCYRCLTDRLTTLKDRATQLLIKYKSGALVTQENDFMYDNFFLQIIFRYINKYFWACLISYLFLSGPSLKRITHLTNYIMDESCFIFCQPTNKGKYF